MAAGYLSTFSITARCPRTGELGIAVSTCEECVGWIVPFVRAGVGAIASQARSNPYFGIDGLRLLERGLDANQALDQMLAGDAEVDRDQRQLAIVDAQGTAAAFTGPNCRPWAGHRAGDGFVAAGNLLVGAETVDAMFASFEETAGEMLGERLVAALEAGPGGRRRPARAHLGRAAGGQGGRVALDRRARRQPSRPGRRTAAHLRHIQDRASRPHGHDHTAGGLSVAVVSRRLGRAGDE